MVRVRLDAEWTDPNGVTQAVLTGPVDEAGASALIESLLGAVPSEPGPT